MIIAILFGICIILLGISTFYSISNGYFSPNSHSDKFYSEDQKEKMEKAQNEIISKYINKVKV